MSTIETAASTGRLRRWAGRAVAFVAVPLLVACSVEADQGGGGSYRPRPQPMCTQEYAPVCAQRGNDRQTFGNTCQARASGFRVIERGECRGVGRPDPRPDAGRACTREYAPVCGQRGRDRQTFPNACEARNGGYDIVGRGECGSGRPDRDRDDRNDRDRPGRDQSGGTRMCTQEYAPVCASRGSSTRTFGNSCQADVEGFRVVRRGEC